MADAMTQAETYIARQSFTFGLLDFEKQRAEEMNKKLRANAAKKLPANTPAPIDEDTVVVVPDATPEVQAEASANFVKPVTSDMSMSCPSCGGTFIQRIANGHRCGACGTQIMRDGKVKVDPGQVRK